MKIIDPEALAADRAELCELCGRAPRSRPLERHHIFTRGMGGGGRLDIPENLIDLGGAWDCDCHGEAQANRVSKDRLIEIVARRLGQTPDEVLTTIRRLQRAPKKRSL